MKTGVNLRYAGTRLAGLLLMLWAATGCLATKADFRLIQDELRASRAAADQAEIRRRAQADSLARVTTAQQLAQITALNNSLRAMGDSLRLQDQRFAAFRIATSQQLTTLTETVEIMKQVQASFPSFIRELRAEMEKFSAIVRDAGAGILPPPVGGVPPTTGGAPVATGAGVPPTGGAPATPGPTQLYIQGQGFLAQQSCGSARRTFQTLITTYPGDDQVPDAMLSIGISYGDCEGNSVAADSVYDQVVRQYPRDPAAGTALYRQGLMLERANKLPEARAKWERVIREFPRNDEASLACAKLNRPNCR
jgi:TolA-binding protein